jgi:hypothetical protein
MAVLKQVVVISSFVFLLAGCDVYKVSVCSTANTVDVPGLEGTHFRMVYDEAKKTDVKAPFTVFHPGVGSYTIDGIQYATCTFGNSVIIEGVNEDKTYNAYLLTSSPSYFDFTLEEFDQAELDAAKIPYQTEKTNFGKTSIDVLAIDNANVPAQTIFNLLHPVGEAVRITNQ